MGNNLPKPLAELIRFNCIHGNDCSWYEGVDECDCHVERFAKRAEDMANHIEALEDRIRQGEYIEANRLERLIGEITYPLHLENVRLRTILFNEFCDCEIGGQSLAKGSHGFSCSYRRLIDPLEKGEEE